MNVVSSWDVGKVLGYLKTTYNLDGLSLRDPTLKTVMVVPAQRGQTIHYLNLDDTISPETLITFILRKPLKQSKPGVKLMVVQFTSYPSGPQICVITALRMYFNLHKMQMWCSLAR